jgi:hypothetical protein
MKRKLMLSLAALAFVAACTDSPVAPTAVREFEVNAATVAPTAFPDTSDYRNLAGQLWICNTGHGPGTDFHYAVVIRDRATGGLVARGIVHGVDVGQCVMAVGYPTDTPAHWTAVVKQDAPTTHYMAHGFFNFGYGFPTTPPPSAVNLTTRTMSSAFSNDAGVVMSFYNLFRTPPS